MKNKNVYVYDFKINKSLLDDKETFTNMKSYSTEIYDKTVYYKILNFYINNMTKDHFIVSKKLVFCNKTVISFDIMRYENFTFYRQSNILIGLDDCYRSLRKVYKKILRKFKRYNCNILSCKIKINKNFIRGLTNDYL